MANSNKAWDNFFLGFGIIVVLSGIYYIFQKDYLQGICGASVGLLLIYMNRQQKKQQ